MSNELVTTSNDLPAAGGGDVQSGASAVSIDRSRKAEIERIRATDFDRYERENLDRELIELLKAETEETTPTDPMDPDTSRSLLSVTPEGKELVRGWDGLGGFKMQLQRLQNQVGGLVKQMGDDRHQRVFMERFDRALPESIRYPIYEALAMGPPTFVNPVSDKQIKEFTAGAVGADLVKEWGSAAPELIATIFKRVDMLKQRIGDDAMEMFKDWFGTLSAPETKAVLRFIAGQGR